MESVQYVTIPLSGTVSGEFSLRNTTRIGVHAPAVQSGPLLLQASHMTEAPNSASFFPLWRTDGSTRVALAAGSANAYYPLGQTLADALWARIEGPGPSIDVRTFTVLTQAR
jgi:hypothetical protein